jgi:hypothetical protein
MAVESWKAQLTSENHKDTIKMLVSGRQDQQKSESILETDRIIEMYNVVIRCNYKV